MSDRLTNEQIDEMERLVGEATAGRWLACHGNDGDRVELFLVRPGEDGIRIRNDDDTRLIAALHNAAPALIAAARREAVLREACEAVRFEFGGDDCAGLSPRERAVVNQCIKALAADQARR